MAIVLRRGDKGKAVRELQGLLNSKSGKIVLHPDGDFGANTEKAVKEFQQSHKLRVDGVVGAKTWDALHSQTLKGKPDEYFPSHDAFSLPDLQQFFVSLAQNVPQGIASAVASLPKPTISAATPPRPVASPSKPSATPQVTNAPVAPAIVKGTDFKNFHRPSFQGYEGRAYVIKDFKKFEGGAIQLRRDGKPNVLIVEPGSGALPVGIRNECASYVQYFGIPNTSKWLRGPRVCDFKPGELPEGTVIATLRDSKYYSDYSGRSHVGIYLSHDDYANYLSSKIASAGITMMEQYNGHRISRDTKKYAVEADKLGANPTASWTDSKGVVRNNRVSWGKDGEEYYVLLTTV